MTDSPSVGCDRPEMSQFMSRPPRDTLDSHYVTQRSAAAATGAVQFPTPVSANSLPALAPNIDNPHWQHASVLPSVNSSAVLVTSIIGQTHGQYGQLQAVNNSSTGRQPAQPASVEQ